MRDKELFISLLRDINRPNTEKLICKLDAMGFFQAPASASLPSRRSHFAFKGGLLEHTLNVYYCGRILWKLLRNYITSVPYEEVVVSTLLHDVCKADRYILCEGLYVKAPDASLPIGHSEKSLTIILGSGYPLNESEICAIRFHMAPFRLNHVCSDELSSFETSQEKYPLVTLLECADTLCAKIIECKNS